MLLTIICFVDDVFSFSWSLVVNHNNPPSPPGTISFQYTAGSISSSSTFNSVAPDVSIIDQPVNHFYPVSVAIPTISGMGTLQVVYNVNGASSPDPKYYQCIDLYVQ